jgi:hypothetical protein
LENWKIKLVQSRLGNVTSGAKPALDSERKLSDLLVDGEERRVGGWREGDEERGWKLSLPWWKQQQNGEVSRAKIALKRSESFSL